MARLFNRPHGHKKPLQLSSAAGFLLQNLQNVTEPQKVHTNTNTCKRTPN
ncbi:hypothetical protein EXN66_Car018668 [Channa argus]|uniref:Uncharacterized protein n=1 Tax=Channa argus TaxID=215402 RepID=A0A6G1QJU8_CHAAH|nr:hypothetical protein EXN66_Car018668 [Channa argus]